MVVSSSRLERMSESSKSRSAAASGAPPEGCSLSTRSSKSFKSATWASMTDREKSSSRASYACSPARVALVGEYLKNTSSKYRSANATNSPCSAPGLGCAPEQAVRTTEAATAILDLRPFFIQRRYRIVTRAVRTVGTLLALIDERIPAHRIPEPEPHDLYARRGP